jgi:outer membrane protein, heavy metal efflux system
MFLKNLFSLVAGMLVTGGLVTVPSFVSTAGTNTWTLEAVVRRTMEVAPEIRSAEAEIIARAGELTQAGAWPNPTADLRADDRLGQEDGRGGTDLTQIALSQPLPLRRLARQRAAAGANLESARENRRYQRLLLERDASRVFYVLQYTEAGVGLARSRLDLAEGYGRPEPGGKARDPLVRYLTPLERIRLAVLREEARQTVMVAEKDYQKALAEFLSLLALPADTAVQAAPLELPAPPPELAGHEQNLDAHPLLASARREVEAARAGVAVAESQRFADPALNLFRERDFLNGERRDVTGIGISVQIPLWNQNRGPVAKARAEVLRAQAQLGLRQRDTLTRLSQSYTELARLIEQAQRTRTNLLEPARQVFELTRRGFTSGELNLFALVDANNTHFDAQARYLDLLKEAHVAAAELRLAAGISLLEEREVQP